MYDYKTIKIEMDGNVAILTLNRPERHNCLNNTMAEEIADFYTKADEDPNIRCILLTGGTGKGFCGGADLVEWDEMNEKNDMVALDIWNKNDHKMILTMKNVKIYDNSAKVGGGFVLQSNGAQLIMEDCEIYNNTATQEGAGAYIYTYCTYTATNCHFHDNVVQGNGGGLWSWATSFVYLNNCLFENNEAKNEGGAIWTRNDGFFIDGCTIRNNTASGNGGAIFAGRMSAASDGFFPHMNITNTLIENNISGGIGGGAYMSTGAMCHLTDVTFLNNAAAAEAGAIWAKDEFSMHNVTATGNTSGGEGHAVYLADSEYDGHSYIAGLMEMSGSIKIHDNPGGDLYLGKQTNLTITELGIAEDTKINVTLYSGLLTQLVWGAYDYEGGDLVYTITHGNRSIVDPEIPQVKPDETEPVEGTEDTQPQQNTEPAEKKENTLIYAGLGAFIAVIAAAAAIVILLNVKKKKAAAK